MNGIGQSTVIDETGSDLLARVLDDQEVLAGFSRLSIAVSLSNPNLPDNPIVYVNDAFERVTGYSRSSALGRNCRFLQGDDTDPDDVRQIREAVETGRELSIDLLNYRANGEPFINRLTIAPLRTGDGRVPYYIGLQKALREEETEARHGAYSRQLALIQTRVQTDLAMLIEALRPPSRTTSVGQDFAALSLRIECLQMLYEEMRLADSSNFRSGIQMASFLSRLATAVAHLDGRQGISMTMQVARFETSVEVATRIGLILTEVMTNAFRHAFDGLETGAVEVSVSQLSEGGFRVVVADDGVGLGVPKMWPTDRTTGGRLVLKLLDGLDGSLNTICGAAGTVVSIDVPAGA